jgi:hypothetical protein
MEVSGRHACIDRLGERLMAIGFQFLDIDLPAIHRPEAATAGLVSHWQGPLAGPNTET